MKKKLTLKGTWQLIKEAGNSFWDDRVLKLSASLAYYTVFSLAPMLIVIIFLCGLVWGRDAIEGTIYGQIKGFVGPDAAFQLQEMIKNAFTSNKSNITAIVGFATLLVGTTSVFAEIQDSINMIWGLKPKPKKGWLKILLNRLLSFSLVVSLGFLMLVTLVINGLLEALSNRLFIIFPDITVIVVYIFNLILSFVVISLLFALIFKLLPDAKIKWKDVMIGAMATAVLFMAGKFAITFYIGSSNIGSTYGTAGSLVVILIWIYYSAIILYYGAEFTKVYALHYGSKIYPSPYAVWIKQVEVEEGRKTLKQEEEKKKIENEITDETIKVK